MLFNSLEFAFFLIVLFALYWFVFRKSFRSQNVLLLLASYVFYAWWDWRFLGLIIASSLVDFAVARCISGSQKKSKRRLFLTLSLTFNLGLLGFFKYYNFFIESWVAAWQNIGVQMEVASLKIILPVGISFYTFQTLSYTIDVYREKLEPNNNLVQFMAYVAFFPQLVAGPIERAKNLLPQFQKEREFNREIAMSGVYLIVWGLFKKVVVADNCAFFVNRIFDMPGDYSSLELFLGAILFGFQIYGDFSGYSDIAIGVARLFGFTLMTNFIYPYFSRDIAEFWRRWHISLSTWFRDYLYIPLGGSRGSRFVQLRNVLLVFLISGFWHGANWTFIVWGLIHGMLFLPLMLSNNNRKHIENIKMKYSQIPGILMTFVLVSFAWIFFRADHMTLAIHFITKMLSFSDFGLSIFFKTSKMVLFSSIILTSISVMFLFEYLASQRNQKEVKLNKYTLVIISLLIIFMGVFKNPSDFIYFQF